MNMNQSQVNAYSNADGLSLHALKTFGWMFFGLLTTFIVAMGCYITGIVYALYYTIPFMSIIAVVVEVGLVIFLSARIHKMSVGTARFTFFLYAAVSGITFSTVFVAFDMSILILVFAFTCGYFGLLAVYGMFTKRDLTRLAPIITVGLFVMIIFYLFSMFMDLGFMDTVMCYVGLFIFMGCTAYDTQKIRHNYQSYSHDSEMVKKLSIMSALELYLDFINIFMLLLRLFSGKDD